MDKKSFLDVLLSITGGSLNERDFFITGDAIVALAKPICVGHRVGDTPVCLYCVARVFTSLAAGDAVMASPLSGDRLSILGDDDARLLNAIIVSLGQDPRHDVKKLEGCLKIVRDQRGAHMIIADSYEKEV